MTAPTVLKKYDGPHPRSEAPPGTWWLIPSGESKDDQKKCFVSVKCPRCKAVGSLREPIFGKELFAASHGHTIGHDGLVSPSVVCVGTGKPCNWHVTARLEGWKP